MKESLALEATRPGPGLPGMMLKWSGMLLITTVWISSALFGLYILAFYASALYQDNMERWNEVLPRLYEGDTRAATSGIGVHFAAGGLILLMGSIQMVEWIRLRFPAFHRWVGRIYIVASLAAALGGLIFIFIKGTVGGTVMDLGFGLYGVLMFIAAIATYRYARLRRLELHRAWAIRLYALAIGSWLYRIDYGFWILLADGAGHGQNFSGPFDQVMAFFFYIPNLLIAELFIRAGEYRAPSWLRVTSALVLLAATGLLVVGSYYFTLYYWGPAIVDWVRF